MAKTFDDNIQTYVERVREKGNEFANKGETSSAELWLKVLNYKSISEIIDLILARTEKLKKRNPVILDIGGIPGFGYLYAQTKIRSSNKIYRIQEFSLENTVYSTMSQIGFTDMKIIPKGTAKSFNIEDTNFFAMNRPDIVIIQPKIEAEKTKIGDLQRKIIEGIKESKTSVPLDFIIATVLDDSIFEAGGLVISEKEEKEVEFLIGGRTKMSIFIATYNPQKKMKKDKDSAPKEGENIRGIDSQKIMPCNCYIRKGRT